VDELREEGTALVDALSAVQTARALTNEEMGKKLGITANYWNQMKQRPVPRRRPTHTIARNARWGFPAEAGVQRAANDYLDKWLSAYSPRREATA
jgi:hypothetical protein